MAFLEEEDEPWTEARGAQLQEAIDAVMGVAGDELGGLDFSLTIADPSLPDCPLIGCSLGFCTLCGYSLDEIIGRNCRFLVEPVPRDKTNNEMRVLARDFCETIREGEQWRVTESQKELLGRFSAPESLFCAQLNARKDGTLFPNMFYLQPVELDDKKYIIGLQCELPPDVFECDGETPLQNGLNPNLLKTYKAACKALTVHLDEVIRVLARLFWYSGPLRRQEQTWSSGEEDDDDLYDGKVSDIEPSTHIAGSSASSDRGLDGFDYTSSPHHREAPEPLGKSDVMLKDGNLLVNYAGMGAWSDYFSTAVFSQEEPNPSHSA